MTQPRPLAGRYEFLRTVQGAPSGVIWLAKDLRLGVEVVAATVSGPRAVGLKRIVGMRHPNLATVLQFIDVPDRSELPGEPSAGTAVAVAEAFQGETLHERVEKEKVPPRKAVNWFLQAAKALRVVHARGGVHGALSPRCILVRREDGPAPLITNLRAIANGAYCSPERAQGAGPSAEDDCWALHASFFTALTRGVPFEGKTREQLALAILQGRVPLLSSHGVNEPALQGIIDRGLDPNAGRRPRSVVDLEKELEAWLITTVPDDSDAVSVAPPPDIGRVSVPPPAIDDDDVEVAAKALGPLPSAEPPPHPVSILTGTTDENQPTHVVAGAFIDEMQRQGLEAHATIPSSPPPPLPIPQEPEEESSTVVFQMPEEIRARSARAETSKADEVPASLPAFEVEAPPLRPEPEKRSATEFSGDDQATVMFQVPEEILAHRGRAETSKADEVPASLPAFEVEAPPLRPEPEKRSATEFSDDDQATVMFQVPEEILAHRGRAETSKAEASASLPAFEVEVEAPPLRPEPEKNSWKGSTDEAQGTEMSRPEEVLIGKDRGEKPSAPRSEPLPQPKLPEMPRPSAIDAPTEDQATVMYRVPEEVLIGKDRGEKPSAPRSEPLPHPKVPEMPRPSTLDAPTEDQATVMYRVPEEILSRRARVEEPQEAPSEAAAPLFTAAEVGPGDGEAFQSDDALPFLNNTPAPLPPLEETFKAKRTRPLPDDPEKVQLPAEKSGRTGLVVGVLGVVAVLAIGAVYLSRGGEGIEHAAGEAHERGGVASHSIDSLGTPSAKPAAVVPTVTATRTVATAIDPYMCVKEFLPPGAFAAAVPLEPVCAKTDPSEVAEFLDTALKKGAGKGSSDGGKLWASLGWYELPAVAMIRAGCCPPLGRSTYPQGGTCAALEPVVAKVVVAAKEPSALVAAEREFEEAARCWMNAGGLRPSRYKAAPDAKTRAAFGEFLTVAATRPGYKAPEN